MADSDDITTPPDLAGQAYESTVRSKAAQLKQKLINQTLDDARSAVRVTETEWAAEHQSPGSDTSPPREQDFGRYNDIVRNQYYEWVVPSFERYLTPDPDATNPMIETLNAIQNNFAGTADGDGTLKPSHPGLVRIGDALNDMTHWVGSLQENLIDSFLSPLQTVAHNEATVAQVARVLLLLNKRNYIRYRDAVLKLLDKSMVAVDHLANTKSPKKVMWGTLVVTSIGTVLSAIPTGPTIVLGTTLDVAGTLGGALVPEPQPTNDLSAPTAQEVAVNIANALSTLDADTDTADKGVVDALHAAYGMISHWRSSYIASNTSGPLNVARPALDTAPPSAVVSPAFRPSD